MKRLLFVFFIGMKSLVSMAQFAPQVTLPGSDAIHQDSSIIIDWATNCSVQRGWLDIANQTLGVVSQGVEANAQGKADGLTISLGDGGEAVYYFQNPITDDIGPDFTIFENGFANPADSEMAYLELAKVAVSNNGVDFFWFDATSDNDTNTQIAGFGQYMNARKVNNLAGKYVSGHGAPFDLEELKNEVGLDVHNIRYIKIKDVVGSINENICTRDQYLHKINDPYPTPFATGGFDLDALGIIHQKYPTGIRDKNEAHSILIYPNPVKDILVIEGDKIISHVLVYNLHGTKMQELTLNRNKYYLSHLPKGNYLIRVVFMDQTAIHRYINKY